MKKSIILILLQMVVIGSVGIVTLAEINESEKSGEENLQSETREIRPAPIPTEQATEKPPIRDTNEITGNIVKEQQEEQTTAKDKPAAEDTILADEEPVLTEKMPPDQLLIQKLLTPEQQEELKALPKDPLQTLELVAKRFQVQQREE